MTAHWGLEDPAAVEGTDEEKRRAFFRAYTHLQNRINIFMNLPFDKLDRLALQNRLHDIGKTRRKHIRGMSAHARSRPGPVSSGLGSSSAG